MKILKHHRGFTTNSSSSSEWVAPKVVVNPDGSLTYLKPDGTPITHDPSKPKFGPQSTATIDKSGSASTTSNDGEATTNKQTADAPATNALAAPITTPAERSVLADNMLMLGGLVLAVLGVFAIERLVRRKLKQLRSDNDV